MIETLVLIGHLLVAMTIVLLVLLQRGKGAEAGTGFGAGASGTVFGARGSSSFFSRATAILATLFFVTSLALAYFSTQTSAPERLVETPLVGGAAPAAADEASEVPLLPVETAEPAGEAVATPPSAEAPSEEGADQ